VIDVIVNLSNSDCNLASYWFGGNISLVYLDINFFLLNQYHDVERITFLLNW